MLGRLLKLRRPSRSKAAYPPSFFFGHENGSSGSAAVVVPLLLRTLAVTSVIDVGCGNGTWLAEFARNGVAEFLGVDGDYVPRALLRIPPAHFVAADLATYTAEGRRFDLACSLEVAEHLGADRAAGFVGLLVSLAPVVLFSAAIPGQGGTNHVNEQWQSYWAGLFAAHGYVGVDAIRPFVFGDERVSLWYRQNTILYCRPDKILDGFASLTQPYEFDRIDPELFRAHSR